MDYKLSTLCLWAALRERDWSIPDTVDATTPAQRWIPFARENREAHTFVNDLQAQYRVEYSLRQLSFAVTMLGAERRGEVPPGILNVIEVQRQIL